MPVRPRPPRQTTVTKCPSRIKASIRSISDAKLTRSVGTSHVDDRIADHVDPVRRHDLDDVRHVELLEFVVLHEHDEITVTPRSRRDAASVGRSRS